MVYPGPKIKLALVLAAALTLLIICVWRSHATEDEEESPAGPIIAVLSREGEVFQIPLERFLTGVVAAEMPASFQEEALAAQAVAARTYILASLAAGGRHKDAVVCCDPACCQAWRDPTELAEADREKVASAVAATAGLALYYDGKLAETPFCSCCGGRTESAAAVWGGERPWLVSVDCPYCGHAPRFASCRMFDLEEAAALLSCGPEELRQMKLLGYSGGGRVDKVELGGRVLTGREVRSALGLDSAAFAWLIQGGRIMVATVGFGHGVGLCQYGADGMAAAGYDCRQILARYYPGCETGKAY
ncbi:MAG: SpoIID/LytB domain-containing protein [Firmicutes bacterium]|nr:SpoIID/LytB domain-containing protein [Bacillota bacterium]